MDTVRTAALFPLGARAEITHMTPTPPRPADKKTSGNPATQAQIAQTVKQQREQKRQEKLAEYQKQVARRKRGKLVWWVVGSTAAVDRRPPDTSTPNEVLSDLSLTAQPCSRSVVSR